MVHGNFLVLSVEATQSSLEERWAEVVRPHAVSRPRDVYAATDTFLAATSRHLAAVEAVLVARVHRHVPGSDVLVHQYLDAARTLEATLVLIKARLYGEAQAIHLDWTSLWVRAHDDLAEHNRLENRLVETLLHGIDPAEVDALARKVFEAERHGPTRPHPALPHLGLLGRASRRLWAVADRFWDTTQGRIIAEPVRPAPHTHDSLMAQYLVADPKFDDHAPVLEHHHRHHGHRPAPGG